MEPMTEAEYINVVQREALQRFGHAGRERVLQALQALAPQEVESVTTPKLVRYWGRDVYTDIPNFNIGIRTLHGISEVYLAADVDALLEDRAEAPATYTPSKLVTECCGRTIDGDDRFCPRCGYECRVRAEALAPSPDKKLETQETQEDTRGGSQ